MLKLKNKLFDVLARNISIEIFEQWLYSDEDVLNAIESDEFVLELVNRDYSNKHISVDLEKLCFDSYSKEEYLVYAVESTCRKLIKETNGKKCVEYALFLDNYYSWDDDYQIIFTFYGIASNLDLVELGHMSINDIISELQTFSFEVLEEFEKSNMASKIRILKNGLSKELVTNEAAKVSTKIVGKEEITMHKTQKKKRKWFEFWKK